MCYSHPHCPNAYSRWCTTDLRYPAVFGRTYLSRSCTIAFRVPRRDWGLEDEEEGMAGADDVEDVGGGCRSNCGPAGRSYFDEAAGADLAEAEAGRSGTEIAVGRLVWWAVAGLSGAALGGCWPALLARRLEE